MLGDPCPLEPQRGERLPSRLMTAPLCSDSALFRTFADASQRPTRHRLSACAPRLALGPATSYTPPPAP